MFFELLGIAVQKSNEQHSRQVAESSPTVRPSNENPGFDPYQSALTSYIMNAWVAWFAYTAIARGACLQAVDECPASLALVQHSSVQLHRTKEYLLANRTSLKEASQGSRLWSAMLPCRSCYCDGLEDMKVSWGELLQGVASDDPSCHYNACEQPRIFDAIRAPANALSNLGFVAAGLIVLAMKETERWRSCRSWRLHTVLLGMVILAEGLASFGYHASLTTELNVIDVRTMYLSFVGQSFGIFLARSLLLQQPIQAWVWVLSYLGITLTLLLSLLLPCGCFCSLSKQCSRSFWTAGWIVAGCLFFLAPISLEMSLRSPAFKVASSSDLLHARKLQCASMVFWIFAGLFMLVDTWVCFLDDFVLSWP